MNDSNGMEAVNGLKYSRGASSGRWEGEVRGSFSEGGVDFSRGRKLHGGPPEEKKKGIPGLGEVHSHFFRKTGIQAKRETGPTEKRWSGLPQHTKGVSIPGGRVKARYSRVQTGRKLEDGVAGLEKYGDLCIRQLDNSNVRTGQSRRQILQLSACERGAPSRRYRSHTSSLRNSLQGTIPA